jgi:hypothetical protein
MIDNVETTQKLDLKIKRSDHVRDALLRLDDGHSTKKVFGVH